VTRTYSRRALLGVLATSLAALTGATARPPARRSPGRRTWSVGTAVAVRAGGRPAERFSPRFVCRNEGRRAVRIAAGRWELYRYGDGWLRLASGQTTDRETLAPGEETAWVLLTDDGSGGP